MNNEGDVVNVHECISCGNYLVFPEDYLDSTYECELEEITLSNDHEFVFDFCEQCGYYSSK